ncbi:nuclear GTP-binding protein [Vigna unguiculata]|uniref:Nuclear GTP-binding protein n=1 Tax=Vigna unguiculata TaxID=3917 RepID=A0A4D6NCG6_VIGUN|nr:nuclear GTP-binding protein [Vigna unguiculata]
MVMKGKNSKSKRVSLKKKYKVIRKVKEHNRKKAKKLRLSGKNKVEKDPKSTSPKTLLPQLHLLPHAAPTIDATHCQVIGDAANNGADLHHRSSSDGGLASVKCVEHHSMASMFASLLRLVNIVLLRCYQAIAVDIHH